jgi:hypothetical protein
MIVFAERMEMKPIMIHVKILNFFIYFSYFLEAKSNKNLRLGKASPRKKPTAGSLPRPATAPT